LVWRTRLSWVVFVLGGLCGLQLDSVGRSAGPAWVDALISGYAAWCLYWGLPVVWRVRRPFLARLDRLFHLENRLGKWVLCQSLFLTWAVLYSICGGGLHQFAVQVRRRRGAAPYRPLNSVLTANGSGARPGRESR